MQLYIINNKDRKVKLSCTLLNYYLHKSYDTRPFEFKNEFIDTDFFMLVLTS